MLAYIWSRTLQEAADQLPSNTGRSSVVHGLIKALGLNLIVVPPDSALATGEQLRRYHSPAYIEYLLGNHDISEEFGLEHDCPPFELLSAYALQVASATLTACRLLASREATIAINWDGGRHHASRSRASGFCYVADIVLGIMLLQKETKGRVMYIDLDLHYGDGVAAAFHSPTSFVSGRKAKPPNVLTLSVHHSAPAFFPPPTPLSLLPAADTRSPFTLSIPLQAYPSKDTYTRVFPSIERVYQAYRPDFVVLQLGADGLPGDPVGQYGNWSTHGEGGMIDIATRISAWGPLCVLGGGGYDNANTARAWAGITAALAGTQVSEVPHHDFFPLYAPGFTMDVPAGKFMLFLADRPCQGREYTYR